MYNVSRIAFFCALLISLPFNLLRAQSSSDSDLSELCSKAGFSVQSKAEKFDLYRYEKAFLSFDRIDSFRLEEKQATYSIENGEATIILASAAEMRERSAKKIQSLGSNQLPIRFVLNSHNQVKEQPLN
jgi:hypothetical protein